jgi:lysophospholipase L1-like esterase
MKWAPRASVLVVLAGCSTPNGPGSPDGAATAVQAGGGPSGGTAMAGDAGGARPTSGQAGGALSSGGSTGAVSTSAAGNAQGGDGGAAGSMDVNAGAESSASGNGNGGTEPSGGTAGGGTPPDPATGGANTSIDGGSPPATSTAPDLDTFRLVVIGSSTSAGEGASSSEHGWVSLLTAALGERAPGAFSGRNLSVGGYSSESLLPGSGSSGNIDDAIDEGPNLIVVALAGSNDLSAGVDGETFFERLRAVRGAGEDAGIPVFFVSTAPKDLSDGERETLRDWASEMGETFEPCRIPDQDAEYSPCFLDVFDALANDSLGIDSAFSAGDGIHLNDAGHEEIFRVAEEIIEPYLCSRVACE